MKTPNRFLVVGAVIFMVVGLAVVAVASTMLFRRNAKDQLELMEYTKILELENGLLPEKKLSVQLCQSPAVVDYMKNPDDPDVRNMAFREFKSFQDSFASHRIFWISDKDLKYFSNMEFIYDLDKSDPGNAWYSKMLSGNQAFQFDVNYDIGIKKTLMWIDILVYDENKKAIGLAGTGVELDDFVNSMYKTLDDGVTMYMYNGNREISASRNLDDLENKVLITAALPDLNDTDDFFPSESKCISTMRGVYLLAPVESLGWQLVLFVPLTVKGFFQNALVPFSVFILIAVILLIVYSIRSLFQPLTEVKETAKSLASGDADLTRRLSTETYTPFKAIHSIVNNFNSFMGKMQDMMGTIKKTSSTLDIVSRNMKESVASVSDSMTSIRLSIGDVQEQIENQSNGFNEAAEVVREVAVSINTVNEMIDAQTKIIGESSSAVGQLVKSIEQISGSMESMATAFNVLDDEAQSGLSKQQKVNDRIAQIEQQSQMLQEANTAIASIAEQTNLLAMNAAIEAAHAGEAGKGFAVVADEIRKLSETSSGQSKTIGEQLKNIQDSIGDIVLASQESSSAFESVSTRIQETDNLVQSVRRSLETQNKDSRNVIGSLEDMDRTAENVRRASVKMADGSNHVLDEMNKLHSSLEAVQGSMEAMSENTQKVVKSGNQLDKCVEEFDVNVTKLGADVARFKTT
ncbi:MAG: hypothetical protein II563_05005 [Treponema sp.]|nr:hypothetical protein [Treponema sp.]